MLGEHCSPCDSVNRTLVKVWKVFSPQNLVETWKLIDYLNAMSQSVEKRLECLEREFSELRARALNFRQGKKDWRSTFGTLEDDEMTREAERLGREYREQQSAKSGVGRIHGRSHFSDTFQIPGPAVKSQRQRKT
jgi:hypothetical protein